MEIILAMAFVIGGLNVCCHQDELPLSKDIKFIDGRGIERKSDKFGDWDYEAQMKELGINL